jgi:hypothetical protein
MPDIIIPEPVLRVETNARWQHHEEIFTCMLMVGDSAIFEHTFTDEDEHPVFTAEDARYKFLALVAERLKPLFSGDA